ncbi:MAG: hypothetical protein ACLRTQ_09270 [Candidatus Borkfalkia sp.]
MIIFMGIVGHGTIITRRTYLPEAKTLATGLQAFSITPPRRARTRDVRRHDHRDGAHGDLICLYAQTIINNTVTGD